MKHRSLVITLLAAIGPGAGCLAAMSDVYAQTPASTALSDTLTSPQPTVRFAGQNWRVEAEPCVGCEAAVHVRHGRLDLDSPRGLTVWREAPLQGHYEIRFTRTVLHQGGAHDRVSDLNQFWLANSVDKKPVLGRSGRLSDYDDLDLYYVGVGGNGNTTTRFRHYDGTAGRPLLNEYLDAAHLLRANHPYRIRIVVDGAGTRFYVDGQPWFADSTTVATRGYFGLRTTASHQVVDHFSIRALP
jgi:hypothetical protein